MCREELAAAVDFYRVLEGVKLWPVAENSLAGKQAVPKTEQGQSVNKQLSLLKMLLKSEIERLQARSVWLCILSYNVLPGNPHSPYWV